MAQEKMYKAALEAIDLGQTTRARDLFTRLLRSDSSKAEYWLWMSTLVDTSQERIYCLESALRVDPNNEAAKRGLIILGVTQADKDVSPVPTVRRHWEKDAEKVVDPPKFLIRRLWENRFSRFASLAFIGIIIIGVIIGVVYNLPHPEEPVVVIKVSPFPTRTPEPTLSPTPTRTLVVRSPTPTFLGPTPLWIFLPVTYTPIPLYVNTPHPMTEAYRSAIHALERSDWTSMLGLMKQAVLVNPDSPDLYYYTAEAYRMLGEYEDAVLAYGTALETVAGSAAYAGQRISTLLTQALFSTQGELLRGIASPGTPSLALSTLNINQAMLRWAPDVRQRLYQFQLASTLYMPYSKKREHKVTLWRRTTIAGPVAGPLTAKYMPLVSLRRPRYDYKPPGTPPPAGAPGNSLLVELKDVLDMAPLRPERTAEILAQVSPPFTFFAAVLNLQAGRRRRTFELMATANTFASVAVQQFKHAFRIIRPADRSSLIQPMVATPGHGSYPAGHSTQGEILRQVLASLLSLAPGSERYGQLLRLADRIGENRIVAGLHYPVDISQGRVLGTALAAYFISQAAVANTPLQWLWKQAKAEQ